MEANGLSGGNNGVFSNISGTSAMLGLEMSLNNQQNNSFPQPFAGTGVGKQPYPYAPKQRNSPHSDEEEPHSNNISYPTTTEESAGAGDGKFRKGSPWQRMKWTDNMVRLLIMVVFYIGDEAGSDPPGSSDPPAKKKVAGACVLQKKGKWKSVSRAMMERGFYVSPQQCEDKFNDLNKRYKRVNDILGKGTACKVVENQSLLESMDHLPAKMKEEARKLLNSKHLFFREMCAYHNSCGVAGAGSGVDHHSSPPEVTQTDQPHHPQNCVHSNGDDDEEDEDDGDEDEEDDGIAGTGRSGRYHLEEDEEDDGLTSRKRGRLSDNDGDQSFVQHFNGELMTVIHDQTKNLWEKKQWMKGKMMQLEEQRVGYEGEGYELEKQRLKWVKFSCKKEREMEAEKLRNVRKKLENERMVLMLKQKEMELVDLQQHYSSGVHRRTSD